MRIAIIGGFNEYIEISKCAVGQSVYIVLDKIENNIACLIESFTIGVRVVLHIGNIEKEKNAVVFAVEAIGLTAAMIFKYLGAGMEACNLLNEIYLEKIG